MRILFLSYAYPNVAQPQLATFNRTMLSGLAEAHTVRVIAPVAFWQHRSSAATRNTYSTLKSVPASYPAFYYPPKILRAHYDRFLWWSIRREVRRVIGEFQPDVVLSYWAHPDGAVAVRAAHEAGIPAAVMVGGSDVLLLGRSGSRRRAILSALNQADAVIAVSEDIATTLAEDGIPAARTHVVARGVDRELFATGSRASARAELGLPHDQEILIGVGRLVDVKNWPLWIEACAELQRRGRPISGYLLGGGPLAQSLQQMLKDRYPTARIEIRGPQPQHLLAQWYQAADLTVLTSHSEGIPNVLLETLAAGGSFVATCVGGIPEIADPVWDRLVPAGNSAALVTAIADRLDHPPPAGLERRYVPPTPQSASRKLAAILESLKSPRSAKRVEPSTLARADIGEDWKTPACTGVVR